MAYTPSPNKMKSSPDNFGGQRTDANRVAMTVGNNILSRDAAASPVTSPATINGAQTLTVPQNAVAVVICSVTNAVQVSEDSTMAAYFSLPAGTVQLFYCANQQYVYLDTASSTVVNFQFITI